MTMPFELLIDGHTGWLIPAEGRGTMNALLHDLHVIYKQGNVWLLYSKYQKTGWTQLETHIVRKSDGTEKVVLNTKWTQKGRLGLYDLLKEHGILPLIERDKDDE